MRVAEVGREKQENLRHASVTVLGSDLSARVEALYLAGAGIGTLRVDEVLSGDVAALNSEVVIETSSEKSEPENDLRVTDLDPTAEQIFRGASRALRKMKAIFVVS
ncbi:MAG: hypothetical protein ABI183_07020 [Polyangiaceae bacterium]